MTLIPDWQFALLSGLETEFVQFDLESVLVDPFEKAWAENVVNFVSTADDLMSEVIDLHTSSVRYRITGFTG
jgi:hypothetical protein